MLEIETGVHGLQYDRVLRFLRLAESGGSVYNILIAVNVLDGG